MTIHHVYHDRYGDDELDDMDETVVLPEKEGYTYWDKEDTSNGGRRWAIYLTKDFPGMTAEQIAAATFGEHSSDGPGRGFRCDATARIYGRKVIVKQTDRV
jgi:hypothetical protein